MLWALIACCALQSERSDAAEPEATYVGYFGSPDRCSVWNRRRLPCPPMRPCYPVAPPGAPTELMPTPPPSDTVAPPIDTPAPEQPDPQQQLANELAQPQATPSVDSLAGNFGAARGPESAAPFMMGDAFGGGIQTLTVQQNFATFVTGNVGPLVRISPVFSTTRLPGAGGVVGQSKLAENFSPMPRDRVFLNYSYFDQVPLSASGINVNRYTPGFEKTFFDRWTSIEFRTPVAGTINNVISFPGETRANATQFGDIFMAFKAVLATAEGLAITGGMSMTLPTAEQLQFVNLPSVSTQPSVLTIRNTNVHLQPFGAFLFVPNNRLFVQGLLQVDVASNPNPVNVSFGGQPAQQYGQLNQQTMLNVSIAAGYWFYPINVNGLRAITAIAPIVEMHYNQSLSSANSVTAASTPFGLGQNDVLTLGNPNYQFQLLNTTVGVNVQFGPRASLLVGYATPIGSGSDQQFNGECRALLNYRFGPQNRFTRAQF
jgi:hypothetical protein